MAAIFNSNQLYVDYAGEVFCYKHSYQRHAILHNKCQTAFCIRCFKQNLSVEIHPRCKFCNKAFTLSDRLAVIDTATCAQAGTAILANKIIKGTSVVIQKMFVLHVDLFQKPEADSFCVIL